MTYNDNKNEPRKIRIFAELGYFILILIGTLFLYASILFLESQEYKPMLMFFIVSMILIFGTLIMRSDHYAERNGGSITGRQRKNISSEISIIENTIKNGRSSFIKDKFGLVALAIFIPFISGHTEFIPSIILFIIISVLTSLYCFLAWGRIEKNLRKKSSKLKRALSDSYTDYN